MTAKNNRTNTPTEQNKEDNTLVLYRLELVEKAVNSLGDKFDHQDNIKKSDLVEFRDTILTRFNEIKVGIEKELGKLDENKADKSDVADLKKLVWGAGAFVLTILGSLIVYYITNGGK
jgi:hypothetical protein